MSKPKIFMLMLCMVFMILGNSRTSAAEDKNVPRVKIQQDQEKGQISITIDGREAFVYCYGDKVELPHLYPLRSPSGKLLTTEQSEPWPHHRSFWFADTVKLAGHEKVSDFYNCFYSRIDKNDPNSPFRTRIRLVKVLSQDVTDRDATLQLQLAWEDDEGKTPVLDQLWRMRIVPLEKGEYFLDMQFTVTAAYGDVQFTSDKVHYAWPYVRMHPQFSVDKGGTLTNSEGGVKQAQTDGKPARWVDYVNTVEDATEGLAIFIPKENDPPAPLGSRAITAPSARAAVMTKAAPSSRLPKAIRLYSMWAF